MDYICLDRKIEEKAGLTIPQIVERYGWEKFRDLEEEVVKEAAERDGVIIDTGGGVILREVNIENLKRNGVLVLLTAKISTIVDRIKDSQERPSLTGHKSFIEEVEEVLQQRDPIYRRVAQEVVETDDLGVEEVAEEIIRRLGLSRDTKGGSSG